MNPSDRNELVLRKAAASPADVHHRSRLQRSPTVRHTRPSVEHTAFHVVYASATAQGTPEADTHTNTYSLHTLLPLLLPATCIPPQVKNDSAGQHRASRLHGCAEYILVYDVFWRCEQPEEKRGGIEAGECYKLRSLTCC